jgi:hypothetical protein
MDQVVWMCNFTFSMVLAKNGIPKAGNMPKIG